MKKQIILLMTLAIPVAVFLFLKIFGENKYEVPVFFENGIEGCEASVKPHTVNLELLGISQKNHSVIAMMDTLPDDDSRAFITELVRIQDAFYGRTEPRFILLVNSQSPETYAALMDFCKVNGLNPDHTILLNPGAIDIRNFTECGLGLGKPDGGQPTDMTLVDEEGRIRGFYTRNDKEETDRLILELKILKNDKGS